MRATSTRFGALAMLFAVIAAACGTSTTPSASAAPAAGASAPAASAPAAVKLKDTIVIGMSQEPDTLFTPIGSMQVATNVRVVLSQGLTERDDQNVYQPRLAETTPTLENGGAKLTKTADGKDQLTVTYKIRKGAKFSNGDPVTADDVKYSWELYLNKDVPIVSRTTATYYDKINTPDPSTVEVVYKPGQLDPLYFSFCCTIVPRKVYSAVEPAKLKDTAALVRTPTFAGPYKVKEWAAGSSITAEANADFWLGAPKTKTIIFKFITDTNTLLAQLRSGQIDVATNDGITLDQIPELDKLAAETNMKPNYVPAQVWEHIDFNLRDPKDQSKPHPILQDKKVREALMRGIDREAITKQILYGKVSPINSFIFGANFAKAADADITVYKYDPDAAKKLLDDAGWKVGADGTREKGGAKLELKLGSTAGNKMREQTTQVMANQLKAIGVKATLDLMPSTKWFATRGEGPLSAGTFDLGLYAWVQGDDPQTFIYNCSEIPTKENNFSGQNYPGYCNKDFDAAMKVANEKLLQSERKGPYLTAQKIWTTDLPVMPLYQRLNIDVANKNLKNFKSTPTNTPAMFNVWEWELPAN